MRRPKKPRKMRTRKEKEKPKCVFKSSPFRIKAHQYFEHFKGENTEQKSFFVKQTSQLM
jgi:hypothetical protein